MMEETGKGGGESSAVLASPGGLPRAILGADEPGLLTEARERSWEVFKQTSIPPRAEHLWRYSDPGDFLLDHDLLREPREPVSGAETFPPGSWECSQCAARVAFGGDSGARVDMEESLAQKGVFLLGITEAARRHDDLLRGIFGKVIPPEHGKFEALAGAIWQSGVFLYVPKGVDVERPIHLLRAHDESSPWGGFRFVVVLEEGSRVTLVEEHVGMGKKAAPATRLYGLGEFRVGAGGRLDHVIVQRLPMNARAHITYRTQLGHGSTSAPFMVALGGKHTKIDYGTILGTEGSQTELSGVLFGAGGQVFDHHTVHDHDASHTHSNLEMRTVLTDRAMSAYTGLIRITTGAPFSEAYQENRNLVLSERAKAESIPELEIETDEVQCKHGATVGSVDDNQIFYLMSRGIPRREATRIIVRGFVGAILDKAPADLKGRLEEAVEERLEHIA